MKLNIWCFLYLKYYYKNCQVSWYISSNISSIKLQNATKHQITKIKLQYVFFLLRTCKTLPQNNFEPQFNTYSYMRPLKFTISMIYHQRGLLQNLVSWHKLHSKSTITGKTQHSSPESLCSFFFNSVFCF